MEERTMEKKALSESEIGIDREIDRALGRSILYEVLALALRQPGPELVARLGSSEAREELALVAASLDEGDGAIRRAVDALMSAGSGNLGGPFEALFGHTARGKVPPYETEYGIDDPFRQAQELADIGGFYRAFGLALAPSQHERNDHIAVELEFLSFLCRKEAYQTCEGDWVSRGEVRQAERIFLRDHTSTFARAFAVGLLREAADPFFRAAGGLCLAFLDVERRSMDLPLGPEFVRLRSTEEIDVPMACGSCKLMDVAESGAGAGPGADIGADVGAGPIR